MRARLWQILNDIDGRQGEQSSYKVDQTSNDVEQSRLIGNTFPYFPLPRASGIVQPNGEISEKSHIVPPCFPTAKPTSTFVMFCYVLLQSDEHGVITIYYDEVDLQSGRDHKIS